MEHKTQDTALPAPTPVRFDALSHTSVAYGNALLTKESEYTVDSKFEMDTRDYEDHTFCGIMFNIENHSKQPLEYLEIQSLCVRGDLGPITVWVTSLSYYNKHEDKKQWTLVYRGTHEPSRLNYCPLILQRPIRLEGGERIGIYIHSGLGGDQGLVYDNRHGDVTMSDENLSVQSGMAHIAREPFSPNGMWGFAWRRNRQFVGRVCYGVKYLLWQPAQNIHEQFPESFRNAVDVMLMVDHKHSRFTQLPEHVVWYIINFLPYNWIMDNNITVVKRGVTSSAVEMMKKNYHSLCHKSRSCVIS